MSIKNILIATTMLCLASTAWAQRIFMVGDSHVTAPMYPGTVGDSLKTVLPDCEFDSFGIVGAGFYTYNKSEENMARILEAKPEVLIVHLGTNDSYAAKFNPETFTQNMTTFYDSIHAKLPDCKVVFVTPFYNKRKNKTTTYKEVTVKTKRGKTVTRRKPVTTTNWVLNENTRLCADAIQKFCDEHPGTYCIDNNRERGMDFIDEELIRKDFVHLTKDGYVTLGNQVYDSLRRIEPLWGNVLGPQPQSEDQPEEEEIPDTEE